MKNDVNNLNDTEFDLNLFWKYEDNVNESSAFSENILKRLAVNFQFKYVPSAKPAEIQNASIPAEKA